MIDRVLSYIKEYSMFPENGNIVAGVSGGPDSVCLLLMLVKLREQFGLKPAAVHINHGMRKDAGDDAAYVKELCRKWEVPFILVEADVKELAEKKGLSCEEAGRQVRYAAFEKELRRMDSLTGEKGRIAVAHNRDDRAETFLFHLLRGTGLDGMAGIRPVRVLNGNIPEGKAAGEKQDGIAVIRPLLCCSRMEIEEYLVKERVAWRTDSTNAQDLYTRNRIRNRILPYAEENICRGAREHLAREAAMLADTADFVREKTQEALAVCKKAAKDGANGAIIGKKGTRLAVAEFQKLGAYLQGMCIRECMLAEGSGRDLSAAHIEAVRALFLPDCQSGRKISIPSCNVTAAREFGNVVFSPDIARIQECISIPLQIGRFTVPGLGAVKTRLIPGPKACKEQTADIEYDCDNGKKEVKNRLISLEAAAILQNIPEKKYTKWLDYDKIIQYAVFRTRCTKDYLTVNDTFSHKSLKRYMIEEKIPADMRDTMMLLADGAHIIWVPGYRISTAYKVTEQTAAILEITIIAGRIQPEGNGHI